MIERRRRRSPVRGKTCSEGMFCTHNEFLLLLLLLQCSSSSSFTGSGAPPPPAPMLLLLLLRRRFRLLLSPLKVVEYLCSYRAVIDDIGRPPPLSLSLSLSLSLLTQLRTAYSSTRVTWFAGYLSAQLEPAGAQSTLRHLSTNSLCKGSSSFSLHRRYFTPVLAPP